MTTALRAGQTTPSVLGWESSEFPILCQTCLGDNPYMRMTKEQYGKECKICSRPFTIFRWLPGKNMRFKKTEICQTCAKLKNVCQTCILDLEYNLPVEVRDKLLGQAAHVPRSDVNREYFIQSVANQIAKSDNPALESPYTTGALALTSATPSVAGAVAAVDPGARVNPETGAVVPSASYLANPTGTDAPSKLGPELLPKLARRGPYYARNAARICSFFVKGECKRGDTCPYRHELPHDPSGPLAKQNIVDRFYGQNDPVAAKMLGQFSKGGRLAPPEDKTITTLYVGNLDDSISETDLRDHFHQFGDIRSITISKKAACAFVTFSTREFAEVAASRAHDNAMIHNRKLKVMWGKSSSSLPVPGEKGGAAAVSVPGLPGAAPVPGMPIPASSLALPPLRPGNQQRGLPAVYYPSQDPQRMGSGKGGFLE